MLYNANRAPGKPALEWNNWFPNGDAPGKRNVVTVAAQATPADVAAKARAAFLEFNKRFEKKG